ncbi:deoxyribodipyrimidine photo-lyase [Lentithecium fluviatile CBS 122367]|uniref:Deoxyribodipyrimidine photo-lyase n=1 Tax=Lentithecium fluviatile CBS 122367 TaxID=1168545 RepID=A0A6G1IL06_9PLEO|nr:deoxyribodipyrimidine photo-lyase [Lentithecium fluviatile CBS 122367]
MPPKRRAKSQIPPNAASATAYTDPSGTAPNKRSKLSKPLPNLVSKDTNGGSGHTAVVTNGRGGIGSSEETQFDHSRPEERAGIVDRRYYPAEMSNERCAMYNANGVPRPMEILNATLKSTRVVREGIRNGEGGEAVVHWFKRDLRVGDNTGLSKAAGLAKEKGVGVIGLWIMSPQDWEAHLVSPAKCDFELRSVAVLQKELAKLGIPLWIETVKVRKNVPERLMELARQWGAKNVFCNLEYEPDELRREEKLIRLGVEKGVNVEPCHDDCVVPPGSLKTGAGKQYAVYSPWYRAWVAHLHAHPHLLADRPSPSTNPSNFRAKFVNLFESAIPQAPESKHLSGDAQKSHLAALYPAGEAAALDRLTLFLTEKIGRYSVTRNFPSAKSTACVSMHHAAGTLAARTSVRMARDVNSTKKLDGGVEGIRGWIGEVAWRDFYRHVLVNWPYVCMNKPFKFEYTNIEWEYSDDHFRAWTEGRTGYPIVDAAMRCLNQTAYMHNRLRMITASFLAKHLLLDWRLGEQYFISHLVDGDFASNNGGWGFSSSTGVDPQPYFRVFNPWLQSTKFDAEGEFIRNWVPELEVIEGAGIHNPYEAGGKAAEVAKKNGYPKPIVEHKFARERCLARYKAGIGRSTA